MFVMHQKMPVREDTYQDQECCWFVPGPCCIESHPLNPRPADDLTKDLGVIGPAAAGMWRPASMASTLYESGGK